MSDTGATWDRCPSLPLSPRLAGMAGGRTRLSFWGGMTGRKSGQTKGLTSPPSAPSRLRCGKVQVTRARTVARSGSHPGPTKCLARGTQETPADFLPKKLIRDRKSETGAFGTRLNPGLGGRGVRTSPAGTERGVPQAGAQRSGLSLHHGALAGTRVQSQGDRRKRRPPSLSSPAVREGLYSRRTRQLKKVLRKQRLILPE